MKIVTFMRPTSIVCGVGESSNSDDEKFFEFFFSYYYEVVERVGRRNFKFVRWVNCASSSFFSVSGHPAVSYHSTPLLVFKHKKKLFSTFFPVSEKNSIDVKMFIKKHLNSFSFHNHSPFDPDLNSRNPHRVGTVRVHESEKCSLNWNFSLQINIHAEQTVCDIFMCEKIKK